MNKAISTALLALGVGSVWASSTTVPNYVPGEIIVRHRPGQAMGLQIANRMVGAQVIAEERAIQMQVVRVPVGLEEVTERRYRANPAVQSVERNVFVTWYFTPNDPLFSRQWGVRTMNVPRFWDTFRGDPAVRVAVIDDGMPRNHPDLLGRVLPGRDFQDGDDDPNPDPSGIGHGTHVGGIVVAAANNGVGMAGVGFNVRAVPIRINTLSDSIQANIWAADQGVKVSNMSYGFPFLETSDAHQQATNYAWNRGVLLIAAAGNSNTDRITVPQSDPMVVVIGASTPQDTKADFSNFGNWVDLAAPGTGILSTTIQQTTLGMYDEWDGTSMASPMAAGVAALLFSAGGNQVNNRIVRDAMFASAQPIGNWVVHGRVDAFAALQRIPIGVPTTYSASNVSLNVGTSFAGTLANLFDVDNRFVSVNSQNMSSMGALAGAQVSIAVPDAVSRIMRFELTVRANGPETATNSIFAWNFARAQWELLRNAPLRPTGSLPVTHQFSTTTLGNYIRNNEFRVISRAVIPSRLRPGTYTFNIDQVQVNAVIRQN